MSGVRILLTFEGLKYLEFLKKENALKIFFRDTFSLFTPNWNTIHDLIGSELIFIPHKR